MKRAFSSSWKSSSQVRKQRKYRYNAPLHVRNTFLNAHLSKELRAKHGMRSLPVRKGDEVSVMRGNFAGKKAKVNSVDLARLRVTLEGITRSKRDGSKSNIVFRPSALKIIAFGSDDKRRIAAHNQTMENKDAPHKS